MRRAVEQRVLEAYRVHFREEPEILASAPGRVNLIGEHTDYNGGFVLPCAIDCRVAIAAGPGHGGLYSLDYAETRSPDGCPDRTWADYPRGVEWALADAGHHIPRFQAAFHGDVPRGSGLSSSAAIEAATALAICALNGLEVDRRTLAVLCRRAENGYVGVHSGIMDQYASLLCRSGAALLIDCRTLDASEIPLDLTKADLSLLVCDTRVERSLTGTGYNDRRASCQRAARQLRIPDLRGARLHDLTHLSGEELKRARHVVTENERVLDAVDALKTQDFTRFGQRMYDSHRSLRDDYEVSTRELDAFVTIARETGALGARLTGAGFGGCAIALIDEQRVDTLQTAVIDHFAVQDFPSPVFYRFSPSAGAEIVDDLRQS